MSQPFHVKLFILCFIVHKAIVLLCHPKQTQFTSVPSTPMSKDIYCTNVVIQIQIELWMLSVDLSQSMSHWLRFHFSLMWIKSRCLTIHFVYFFFTLFGTTFSYSPAVQSGSRIGLKIILESAASSSTDRDLGLGIYRLHRKLPKTFLQAL